MILCMIIPAGQQEGLFPNLPRSIMSQLFLWVRILMGFGISVSSSCASDQNKEFYFPTYGSSTWLLKWLGIWYQPLYWGTWVKRTSLPSCRQLPLSQQSSFSSLRILSPRRSETQHVNHMIQAEISDQPESSFKEDFMSVLRLMVSKHMRPLLP